MRTNTGLLVISLTVMSCASAPLPQYKREVQTVVPTTITKQQAYNNLASYLAKTTTDSNAAIKMKDEVQGRIISRLTIECSALKPTLDLGATYLVDYNVDAEIKDNKARLTLEAISYNRRGLDGSLQMHEISSDGQMDDIKGCAQVESKTLTDAIGGSAMKRSDF